MLFSERYKERNRKERERDYREIVGMDMPEDFPNGYAGGYAVGRAKVDTAWREWLRRWGEASAAGLEFIEPPPEHGRPKRKPFWKFRNLNSGEQE